VVHIGKISHRKFTNSRDFEPISLGDHIRKGRLEQGLLQGEAAQQLGVNPWIALNWEKGTYKYKGGRTSVTS
jgi:DNA-binding XRE family transcriptional regulator